MENLIMLGIVVFLAYTLLFNARQDDSLSSFFDLSNTKAMRGFWCIVIIMVHTPAEYQNRIQDLIGSFAYIGVTFFFMTSAYGLTLSTDKRPEKMKTFWRNRIPKLVITGWIVHIVCAIVNLCFGQSIPSAFEILAVNRWVMWLIIGYFFFWSTKLMFKEYPTAQKVVCSILVVFSSLTIYIFRTTGMYTRPVWFTECYGFIWGILLATVLVSFYNYFSDKWFLKLAISACIALVLGVAYLKFKPVIFFGDYLLKIVLGVAITMFILISNVKISYGNKINNFLGEISFEVYLMHGQVFEFLSREFPELSSAVFVLLTIIITIVLSYIAHCLVVISMKGVNKLIAKMG